jgi:hypothetical protein
MLNLIVLFFFKFLSFKNKLPDMYRTENLEGKITEKFNSQKQERLRSP